ncbi:glycosyltransferase family 4 protein [Fodinicola feengrottensis]|uniref:glycosyltransferase family 4 protein n=1 Tax=Fodinicola feengrottensis TaxID=435914 RepID=UPI0024431398|nr:glycosyltransferase family 1 protein [Fodinicola feengrottensis]
MPSKATRDELIRLLDADPTRLDVAYHGVDAELFHQPDDAERARVRSRLGLVGPSCPGGYVAFLGAQEPRKNVPNLIRGWVSACERRADPPALVIAGGSGHDSEIDQAIAEVPARLRLLRPGYLRFADLPGFLGGADVVAYPSHGEGFGLPVLEAMACGAAVLTTPRLSLPEVGGDAVAYTEEDAARIGTDLAALLDDQPRRTALGAAAHDAGRAVHLGVQRRGARGRVRASSQSVTGALYAVIPAGGSGTRLWPLSRSAAPKNSCTRWAAVPGVCCSPLWTGSALWWQRRKPWSSPGWRTRPGWLGSCPTCRPATS